MTKRGFRIIVGMLMALSIANGLRAEDGRLTVQGNLRVLRLDGSPRERGRQHGQALKQDIHRLVGLWKADLEKTHKVAADSFIRRFLDGTDYRSAIRKWTPELWTELEGIAEGSGLDLDTLFAFQLVDETWVLGRDIMAEKCTSIGASKTARIPAIVAQTLDIPAFYHGFQTLLRIDDPEREMETLVFTFPGFIAANGLNSRSVGVVVNAVQQLAATRGGLPVAFVIRGILQQRSHEDAVRFIREIDHGAPQNYLLGGPVEAGSYECSGTTVARFVPFEGASFTYHTNHPLANASLSPRFLRFLEARKIDPADYEHPCPRFAFLQGRLKDDAAVFGVEMLKEIFGTRETGINNDGTFGCSIMVLGDHPEMYLSPGRPDIEPYQVFGFDGR